MSNSISVISSSSMSALSTSSVTTASAIASPAQTKALHSLSINTMAAASSSSSSSSLAQKRIVPLSDHDTHTQNPLLTFNKIQMEAIKKKLDTVAQGFEPAIKNKFVKKMMHLIKASSLRSTDSIENFITQHFVRYTLRWILTATKEQLTVFKNKVGEMKNPTSKMVFLQFIQICQEISRCQKDENKAKFLTCLTENCDYLDVDLLMKFLNELKPHSQKITFQDPVRPYFEKILERLFEENRYQECLRLCEKAPSCSCTGEIYQTLSPTDYELCSFHAQVTKNRHYSIDELFGCGEKEYFFLRIIRKLTTHEHSLPSTYRALSLIASVKGSITIEDHASALCLCAKSFADLNRREDALRSFHLVTEWLSKKKSDMLFHRNYTLYYSEAFSAIIELLIRMKQIDNAYQIALQVPLSTQSQKIKNTLFFFALKLIELKKFDQAIDVIAKMHRYQSDPHEFCYSTDKTKIENLLQRVASDLNKTSEGRQLGPELAKKSNLSSSFKALMLSAFVSEMIEDQKIITEAFGFIQALSCYDMAAANRSLLLYISALIRFKKIDEAVRDINSFISLSPSQNSRKNNIVMACIKEFQRHNQRQAAEEIEKLL